MPIGYDKYSDNHGLVLDLQGYEGTGTLVHDSSNGHRIGNLTGGVSWAALASGQSFLDFDGVAGSYLELTDALIPTQTFTCMAWVNTDVNELKAWMSQWLGGQLGRFILNYHNVHGTMVVTISGADTVIGVIPISLNTWYFVVESVSSLVVTQYVNGMFDAANTLSSEVYQLVSTKIGSYAATGYNWNGKISKPRIWNRALRLSEVKSIFESERYLFGV